MNPVVPYDVDEVTRIVEDNLDDQAYRAVSHLTVGQFREWLLDIETTGPTPRAIAPGLTPEMVAAAAELVPNVDRMTVGAKGQVGGRANNPGRPPGRHPPGAHPNPPP